MPEDATAEDRRRPTVPALNQPVRPADLRAMVGGREVVQQGDVVALTDRTVVVEVADSTIALAFSLAPEVVVEVDLGGGRKTLITEPGRRAEDIPSSRRVELVMRDVAS